MRNNLYICNANPQTKTTLTSPICGSNFGTHYNQKRHPNGRLFCRNKLLLSGQRPSGASLLMVKVCPAAVALTKKPSMGAMAPVIGTNSLPIRR